MSGPGSPGTPPKALADRTHRAWVRFAAAGDPGWPDYDPAEPAVQLLDA